MLTRRVRLRAKPRPGWSTVKAIIRERSGGRCEVVLDDVRCFRHAIDPAHVVRRSTGGKKSRDYLDDPVRVLDVCRPHHEWEDQPFRDGRLVHRERNGIVETRVFWDKQDAREWRHRSPAAWIASG